MLVTHEITGKETNVRSNVDMVLGRGYMMIINSIPREVRKQLNQAVKDGTLLRLPKTKDGLIEMYCDPQYKDDAQSARLERKLNGLIAISKVLA